MFKDNIIFEGRKNGGERIVYKFNNGYGASVISNARVLLYGKSRGDENNPYELCVLKFSDKGMYTVNGERYDLDHSTKITNGTDGVVGYLNCEKLNDVLCDISKL